MLSSIKQLFYLGILIVITYIFLQSWLLFNQFETKQYLKATAEDIRKAEESFKRLQGTESKSLLKKHLTQQIFEELKDRKTQFGGTLNDVITSGVVNPDANVGVYAPDTEAYDTFKELLDPIIQDYHKFGPKEKQPPVDLGDDKLDQFPNLDLKNKYIKSTRIRCGRSIEGYPLNTLMKEEDYVKMEKNVKGALEGMADTELKGQYYPLLGMDKKTQQQLITDHFLFKDNDRHLESVGAFHFWPKGRGIFHNDGKTFLIWLAEEDHMRIISMQSGGDVGQVLGRLNRGIKAIQSRVQFARDQRLGWLTFCPTNLGSTVRASVHIVLPKTSARKDFKKICEDMNLQVRGIHGEHSDSEGGVYDISNKRRLGLSEFQAVKEMYDGVKELILMEENAKSNL